MKKLLLSTLMLMIPALTVFVQAQNYCSPTYPGTGNVGAIGSITVKGSNVDASWSDSNAHALGLAATVDNFFTVQAGTELTLELTTKSATWGNARVYVDKNGSISFNDGENVLRIGDNNTGGNGGDAGNVRTGTAKFTIDSSTSSGKYLMRVNFVPCSKSAQSDSSDPCGTYTEGGYYDFYFNVENPNEVTSPVVFSPVSGTNFVAGSDATITLTSEDGATIYYTTDSTEPQVGSGNSVQSGSSITLDTNQPWGTVVTVKAVAKAGEKDASSVSSAAYTISSPYCTPTANAQGFTNKNYVGQITTLTTTGAEVDANWTNPMDGTTAKSMFNGYLGVIANTFTAKAGQTVTLNINSINTKWGAIRVYVDLNGNYSLTDDGENIARVGDANDGASEKSVSQEFTIDSNTPAGMYLMRVFYVARSNGTTEVDSSNPCGTYTEGGYYDFAFNVVADAPVPTESKNIVIDEAEDGDAAYVNVTVTALAGGIQAPVWSIGGYAISAQELDIEVAADATTPEIYISEGGSITADQISVKRTVKADEWAFMSLPFAITVDNGSIQVGTEAASINNNIKFLVYDGALRASTSVELFSGSGWEAKENGTIDANTGFAVAVNNNNGAEQVVTFSATSFSMDASDKVVSLESYEPAGVNGGIDDNWNFKGNPMLQSASKDEGYSLYIYNPSDDTYSEYSAAELAIFSPFAAWFVQSTGLTNRTITFRHEGTSVASDVEANIDGRFAISINGGEDEARVTVLDGSSESYVINEDAMYFAPNSNKVAQVYMIDGDGMKIASSVVPAPYNEVKLAYNAAVAGAQTLTVTSVIPGTEVYLIDNEEGTETQMSEGSEYTFTSAAGTNSDRFVVKTITDVTGIAENAAETSTVSAVVTGDVVKIYGAAAGETINVYTVNSVLVASSVAVSGENEIAVPANGVLLVKVGDEVIKVIK